ncbi:MAG: class I SAM-dependent methyltransferase [Actinoallomurus sp.]
MQWAVAAYDTAFGYVSAHGAPLLDLLDPQPDERIIDLGCGTGVMTVEIAERGAQVLGIDESLEMVNEARSQHPHLSFAVGDAHGFTISERYDAVFSNSALHWMTRDPSAVISRVHAALRPGGRFVAEMGGAGNCAELIAAVQTAWRVFGLPEPELPWYFPTPAEYATRLEEGGFVVRLLEHFDRPTRLAECPDGAADWVRLFAPELIAEVPPELAGPLLDRVNELAAPALRRESGWMADYVRLRFAAVRKPGGEELVQPLAPNESSGAHTPPGPQTPPTPHAPSAPHAPSTAQASSTPHA